MAILPAKANSILPPINFVPNNDRTNTTNKTTSGFIIFLYQRSPFFKATSFNEPCAELRTCGYCIYFSFFVTAIFYNFIRWFVLLAFDKNNLENNIVQPPVSVAFDATCRAKRRGWKLMPLLVFPRMAAYNHQLPKPQSYYPFK